MPKLYRKRLVPEECTYLRDDVILMQNDTEIITSWTTLHPKNNFAKGISYYVLDKGWKISKFYDDENHLVYIYCDIINTTYDQTTDSFTFTDLLADVIIENDGSVKVVDLDELASAFEVGLISNQDLSNALFRLNALLHLIYHSELNYYISKIDLYEHF